MENLVKITKQKIDDSISSLSETLNLIRAQGANPTLLNHINVEYYGEKTPLNSLANIKSSNGITLIITPYDKSSIQAIVQAISNSSLDLPTTEDGGIIRINVPPLTEESRKKFIKTAKSNSEDAKIKIRNIRKETNKIIKEDESISENEQELKFSEIQKIVDEANKIVDEIFKNKKEQLMKV